MFRRGNAGRFANQTGCIPIVKYVIFVFNITPLGAGKIVGLTISSLLMFVYVIITTFEMWFYLKAREKGHPHKAKGPATTGDSQRLDRLALPITASSSTSPLPNMVRSPPTGSPLTTMGDRAPTNTRRSNPRRSRPQRWFAGLDPMLLGIAILQAVVFTYFIVSIELLLKRNPDPSNATDQWGFGQVRILTALLHWFRTDEF
jgi:hypothetical protein